jgi:hypothetical protein
MIGLTPDLDQAGMQAHLHRGAYRRLGIEGITALIQTFLDSESSLNRPPHIIVVRDLQTKEKEESIRAVKFKYAFIPLCFRFR